MARDGLLTRMSEHPYIHAAMLERSPVSNRNSALPLYYRVLEVAPEAQRAGEVEARGPDPPESKLLEAFGIHVEVVQALVAGCRRLAPVGR